MSSESPASKRGKKRTLDETNFIDGPHPKRRKISLSGSPPSTKHTIGTNDDNEKKQYNSHSLPPMTASSPNDHTQNAVHVATDSQPVCHKKQYCDYLLKIQHLCFLLINEMNETNTSASSVPSSVASPQSIANGHNGTIDEVCAFVTQTMSKTMNDGDLQALLKQTMKRDYYGIKPPRNVDQMRENGIKLSNHSENLRMDKLGNKWDKLRIYEWTPKDPKDQRGNRKKMKKVSGEMNKYGDYCRHYEKMVELDEKIKQMEQKNTVEFQQRKQDDNKQKHRKRSKQQYARTKQQEEKGECTESLNGELRLNPMAKYEDCIESWDFDVFVFMDDPQLCGNGFVIGAMYVFEKAGLCMQTGIDQAKLLRFLENVEQGYLSNPYHNKYHALDVFLTTHFMFETQVFKQHMTMWDRLGAYVAALCHDLGHMGMNNAWYVNNADSLALLYGDKSVLENHHVLKTFQILKKSENDWMSSNTASVRRYLAAVIRNTILATDMSKHDEHTAKLQNMVDTYKDMMNTSQNVNGKQDLCAFVANNITFRRNESVAKDASLDNIVSDKVSLFGDRKNSEWRRDVLVKDVKGEPRKSRVSKVDDERMFLLEITIHACDVANPCKPLVLAKKWANCYLEEAFNQGDMERNAGMAVSWGMDRQKHLISGTQKGFIKFIYALWKLYSELIGDQKIVEILGENKKYWTKLEMKSINDFLDDD
eukprot:811588_1